MRSRTTALGLLLVGPLALLPRTACAYAVDVHFNLTFVLCQLSGLNVREASIVAVADQGMDDNPTTSAFYSDGEYPHRIILKKDLNDIVGAVTHLMNLDRPYLWHALADTEEPLPGGVPPEKSDLPSRINLETGLREYYWSAGKAVIYRRDLLWKKVIAGDKLPDGSDGKLLTERRVVDGHLEDPGMTEGRFRQLVRLGQFLHYEQDLFSHRDTGGKDLDKGTPGDYPPYGRTSGHYDKAKTNRGEVEDSVLYRPKLAKAMARDTLAWLCKFTHTMPRSLGGRFILENATCDFDESLGHRPFLVHTQPDDTVTDVLVQALCLAENPPPPPPAAPIPPSPPTVWPTSDDKAKWSYQTTVMTYLNRVIARTVVHPFPKQPDYKRELSSLARCFPRIWLPKIDFDGEGEFTTDVYKLIPTSAPAR